MRLFSHCYLLRKADINESKLRSSYWWAQETASLLLPSWPLPRRPIRWPRNWIFCGKYRDLDFTQRLEMYEPWIFRYQGRQRSHPRIYRHTRPCRYFWDIGYSLRGTVVLAQWWQGLKSDPLIQLSAKQNFSENKGPASSFCSISFGIDQHTSRVRRSRRVKRWRRISCMRLWCGRS
jgi:hypothetical protein